MPGPMYADCLREQQMRQRQEQIEQQQEQREQQERVQQQQQQQQEEQRERAQQMQQQEEQRQRAQQFQQQQQQQRAQQYRQQQEQQQRRQVQQQRPAAPAYRPPGNLPQRTITGFRPPASGTPAGTTAGTRAPASSTGSGEAASGAGRGPSRTAEHGHPTSRDPARYNRGMAALSHNNYTEALAIFTALAQAGDAVAQYELAQMYENGWGTDQDYAAAIPYLQQSADAGDSDAAYDLAMLTENGLGTTADPDAAQQWYQKAADLNADAPDTSGETQQASAEEPTAETNGDSGKGQSLGTIGPWGAYLAENSSGRVCYVSAELQPIPNGNNQYPLNLTVTHRPGENSFNVVNLIEPFDQGTDAVVDVGGQQFTLFVKDGGAWAATSALDADVVRALSNGDTLSLTGTYDKAEKTYTYQLAGFRNALRLIDKACDVTR